MPARAASRRATPLASHQAAAPIRRGNRFNRSGLVLVGLVALVASLNTTTKFMVTVPPAEWLPIFVDDVAFHGVIGLAVLLAVVRARDRFQVRGARQYAACALAVIAATLTAVVALEAYDSDGTFGFDVPGTTLGVLALELGSQVFRYAVVGLAITAAWLYLCAEADHNAAIAQCEVDAQRMDQQTAEARLAMLEAQIEPHFLFNTLAHVKRLYEIDAALGAVMLRHLEAYLSIALPQMRESASTLAREVDHVAAYLGIQQIRMGPRLAYGIDVPPALYDACVPPLMLLTLVENAVKHGLTPLPRGGRVDVRASVSENGLRIDVIDTGGGFVKAEGGGAGLANTRARLASMYGTGAGLSLALNHPRGVTATLQLPLERAPAARAGT